MSEQKSGALSGITDTVGKATSGVTDTVSGVGEGVGKTVGDTTKGVGDTVKGVTGGGKESGSAADSVDTKPIGGNTQDAKNPLGL